MKTKLLEDEKFSTVIVEKIAFVMGNIDKRSVEKQLNDLDEDTTREIIRRIINISIDPYKSNKDLSELKVFLEGIFTRPVINVYNLCKRLSENLNGKYSPEELDLIFNCEKQLICSLLKEYDIVETRSIVYVKRYDVDCNAIGIAVSPSTDISNVIERKNRKLQNFNSMNRNS